MSNYRQSLGLVSTGLWLLLGCGGRSDMTDYESSWGGTSLHSGGSTATLASIGGLTAKGGTSPKGGSVAQGGTAPVGGRSATGGTLPRGGASGSGNVPAQGGTQWRTGGGGGFGGIQPVSGSSGAGNAMPAGGTTSKPTKGDCCVAHDTPGCLSSSTEDCVCKRDALCCLFAWDAVCVSEMFARGCDSCLAAGGAASGGAANGGTWSMGGVANGGVPNGGAVNTSVSVAFGGKTGNGGAASGGVTSIASGGMPPAGGGIMNSGGTVSTATTPPARQALIDDLEDGNGDLVQTGGRDGYWFTLNDGTTTGTQEPVWGGRIRNAYPITDRPGSAFAAWTQGSGFATWGAGFGLYLRTSARYFNATRYKGITFWAKVAPGRANVVRLNVSDIQTEADGGYCTECWDYFGTTIVMSTNWERYGFVWSDLWQQGWGAPLAASLDSANIRSIEFYTAAGVNFEIYIDDIAFIQ